MSLRLIITITAFIGIHIALSNTRHPKSASDHDANRIKQYAE